ncbi:MAG: hypothetical protein H0T43_12800 [Solirubrobacterales bacterium]|nr:hypothetical protein [Solirubrobacterales bacterium]
MVFRRPFTEYSDEEIAVEMALLTERPHPDRKPPPASPSADDEVVRRGEAQLARILGG